MGLKKRKRPTIEEIEKRGALIKKDPMRYSILFQLEYLNRWTPENPKGN